MGRARRQELLFATGGYVRGNLAISVVAGIASYIVLKVLGVPYAETLAVVVAVLDVIPLVGATIGAVVVSIVGFALGGFVDGSSWWCSSSSTSSSRTTCCRTSCTARPCRWTRWSCSSRRSSGRRWPGSSGVLLGDPAHLRRLGARRRPPRAAPRARRAARPPQAARHRPAARGRPGASLDSKPDEEPAAEE